MLNIVTAVAAWVGSFLGIINTVNSINNLKTRGNVKFQYLRNAKTQEKIGFCISITNLSAFEITIDEIGFLLTSQVWKRQKMKKPERIALYPNDEAGTHLIPKILKSRESFSFNFSEKYLQEFMENINQPIRSTYAKTACERRFTGTTPAFRHLAKKVADKIQQHH
jgi:hypothetical protein